LPRMLFHVSAESRDPFSERAGAALGMQANTAKFFGRQDVENLRDVIAQGTKQSRGLKRIALIVVKAVGPEILIEQRHQRPFFRDHLTEPHPHHELRIRQMADDFANRPLAGKRSEQRRFRGNPLNGGIENLRTPPEQLQTLAMSFGHKPIMQVMGGSRPRPRAPARRNFGATLPAAKPFPSAALRAADAAACAGRSEFSGSTSFGPKVW